MTWRTDITTQKKLPDRLSEQYEQNQGGKAQPYISRRHLKYVLCQLCNYNSSSYPYAPLYARQAERRLSFRSQSSHPSGSLWTVALRMLNAQRHTPDTTGEGQVLQCVKGVAPPGAVQCSCVGRHPALPGGEVIGMASQGRQLFSCIC